MYKTKRIYIKYKTSQKHFNIPIKLKYFEHYVEVATAGFEQ